ncbi:MAG: hypothetical protein GX256_06670 [Fretibacterium sp.]|nr:hypothetical protein [Fretibacterium sp.]
MKTDIQEASILSYDKLSESGEMWSHLGFEPWQHQGMQGVSRKITMKKTSFLGPVAVYYAWDYILWHHAGQHDVDYLLTRWAPLPDVVTQRFVLIGLSEPQRKVRSFCFGFRGFLEIYAYTPGEAHHKRIRDLTPAVDFAWHGPHTEPARAQCS